MRFIADFHVHSKYSRATSKDMDVESMARWASLKGVSLLGTGDFTHPFYFAGYQLGGFIPGYPLVIAFSPVLGVSRTVGVPINPFQGVLDPVGGVGALFISDVKRRR